MTIGAKKCIGTEKKFNQSDVFFIIKYTEINEILHLSFLLR
jgi:hypothetical protein